ncbi:hypothetical protein IF1G_00288 [Cordyceps javanica]|uniref:Vacuolar ATPase assembly protein VMA22 n=1 Tax=Cordyceps javanica TaxID=43265 RepID=A0A545VF52_9HYPO|nr:hypothetical protein IF1G_00288 [Cordyceps javanica]TQW11545.1 hypothetical protein IF2G_00276 [Cordyceps javanica]
MSSEADQTIDELLERYLGLVDQYAALRAALGAAQQRTFHALARANFTADRGARFGRDQYDERMRASRRVAVSYAAAGEPPTFAVTEEARDEEEEEDAASTTAAEEQDGRRGRPLEHDDGAAAADADGGGDGGDGGDGSGAEMKSKAAGAARDPIRWFGVLVPQALRDAQRESVRTVEDVIPRLVSVQAEMAHVEIEVRRARKRRAKASTGSKRQAATTSTAAVVSASS